MVAGAVVAGAVVCVAAGLLELNHECFAGVGDGAAGAGAVVAAVFFECLVEAGDEAGAEAVDVVVVVAGAVVAAAVSFFFERLCLAGDASGLAAGMAPDRAVQLLKTLSTELPDQ